MYVSWLAFGANVRVRSLVDQVVEGVARSVDVLARLHSARHARAEQVALCCDLVDVRRCISWICEIPTRRKQRLLCLVLRLCSNGFLRILVDSSCRSCTVFNGVFLSLASGLVNEQMAIVAWCILLRLCIANGAMKSKCMLTK